MYLNKTMFEKIKKRYALNNSYFKNKRPQDPQDPFEVFGYVKQHNELPYNLDLTDNWLYECFTEYQKRNTEYKFNEQFFTPPKTSKRMRDLLEEYMSDDYLNDVYLFDMCCGYGQLSVNYPNNKLISHGIDVDEKLCKLYEKFTGSQSTCIDFKDYNKKERNIIANPPYSVNKLTAFLEKLYEILEDDGIAVILIPEGFFEKEKPKATKEIINKFKVLYREDMEESFARTNINAEICVIKKDL